MTTLESSAAVPPVVDRQTWLRERAALLDREKAHTREGDAIAAARRRLPMTEVAPVSLIGRDGPTSLVDIFEGREQLIAYKHMFHTDKPFEDQCPGCTASIWDFQNAAYLNDRDITFAVFCEGPWEQAAAFRDFMGYTHPWYSAYGVDNPAVGVEFGVISCFLRRGDRVFLTNEVTGRGVEAIMTSYQLLDMTVYGRQEEWEDSPEGWRRNPRHLWRRDGRPTPQWTRPGVDALSLIASGGCC